jgi:hypothetical protein
LFKGKKQAASVNQNAAAPLQAIGVTRTIYILGLLLVGVSMTGLAIWLAAQGASWERILPFLTVVWIAVVHQILDSLKKIIERREEIRQANWIQPGGSRLEDLAGRDSQQTDRLVRQQCGEELERCRDILNDIRSRVYKAGQMDLALSLRDLERKFDASRGRVLDTQVGAPPYLDATLHITSKDPMLAYDEDLLCAASALSQKAAALQQLAPDGIPPQGMKDLESQLDGFMNRFSARGRALQPPVKI